VHVYPVDVDINMRMHNEMLSRAEIATESGVAEKGIKGCSTLLLLPHFDIIDGFVPEYMQSVLLGFAVSLLVFGQTVQTKPNHSILKI